MSTWNGDKPGTGSAKDPIYVREAFNAGLFNTQFWVNKTVPVKIRQAFDPYTNGWKIHNNGNVKIYVGTADNPTNLKQTGMVINPNEAHASALYVGELYCIADDACVSDQDVRVWAEQL